VSADNNVTEELQSDGHGHRSRLSSALYQEDLQYCASLPLPWEVLDGSIIMVSGATGMIGTFLIDVLMTMRHDHHLDCRVVALGRDIERARQRFPYYDEKWFQFESIDVSAIGSVPHQYCDITFHLASVTHPLGYATDPIGTITSNVIGLRNLLEHQARCRRNLGDAQPNDFVFASSVEIYGRSRGDVHPFGEDYCGYIDSNTLRAAYPESKRLGESLCQAYMAQRGISPVIPRIARTYGPTLHRDDSKALSQFLHRGLSGHDIILKSSGNQMFSYAYVADVVAGLFYCLLRGHRGTAYNIADSRSDIRLLDLAQHVAHICGVSVRTDIPDDVERSGYSTAQYAVMDSTRLRGLGWSARYGLTDGLARTLRIISASSPM
jgi:nucleoside-diphosphate-sugar epimerase